MRRHGDIDVNRWLDLEQFHDPELKNVAHSLPSILLHDRAPGTVTTYVNAYGAWKRWASARGVCTLPANSVGLALYIVFLIQQERQCHQ